MHSGHNPYIDLQLLACSTYTSTQAPWGVAHRKRKHTLANYWQRVTESRISRRRALAATGSTAAAAAFLAACGGSDDDNGGSSSGGDGGSTSGLIHKPVDTTSQAKAGGALKHYAAADIAHFDALASNSASTVNFGSVFAYNRLLKFKSGKYPEVADGTSEGEMAESWEVSPDKLTVTM